MSNTNKLNEAELERLALLMEECAEVQQVIGKIIRHGYSERYPSGDSNREMLEKELGDIHYALDLMIQNDDVSQAKINQANINRACRQTKYLHHN